MTTETISALIDAEISRLTQVRALLASNGKVSSTVTERVTKKTAKVGPAKKAKKSKKRHVLSPEARKRIADAQRKRWAAQKARK